MNYPSPPIAFLKAATEKEISRPLQHEPAAGALVNVTTPVDEIEYAEVAIAAPFAKSAGT